MLPRGKEPPLVDLFSLFPDLPTGKGTGFGVSYRDSGGGKTYYDWEDEIATPALKKLDYTVGIWKNAERDSFGPLSREITVTTKTGQRLKVWYG